MFSISNKRWYCFTSAFFGSVRIFLSEASSRSSSVATRKTSDEFRDQAVLQQVLRLDVAEDFAGAAIFRRQHLCGKADRRSNVRVRR